MAGWLSLRAGVGAALLFACTVLSVPIYAESMVSVVSYSFARRIENLEPRDPVRDPAILKPGENLHLWLEIQVNHAGLKYLRALGKLPVYIRWGRDGWLTDPPHDIGIAPDAWDSRQNGINWKARQGGGTFTWRTNANKATPINGRYYVTVLDANRRVVTTIDLPSEPFRPEIAVRRE